jgi:hypothetical protein
VEAAEEDFRQEATAAEDELPAELEIQLRWADDPLCRYHAPGEPPERHLIQGDGKAVGRAAELRAVRPTLRKEDVICMQRSDGTRV